jgi:hypothetical protein
MIGLDKCLLCNIVGATEVVPGEPPEKIPQRNLMSPHEQFERVAVVIRCYAGDEGDVAVDHRPGFPRRESIGRTDTGKELRVDKAGNAQAQEEESPCRRPRIAGTDVEDDGDAEGQGKQNDPPAH